MLLHKYHNYIGQVFETSQKICTKIIRYLTQVYILQRLENYLNYPLYQ